MLEFARREIVREGLEGRVRVLHARLPQMPLPRATYDAVLSNSLLHHLADPMALWELILRYGRSDCPVLVMDLRRPESEAELEGIVERHAVGAPEVLRRDFTNSLRAAYRVEEVEQQLRRAGLESLQVEVGSDRHLLVHGRRP
jgi:ubiquinone/menaquinone biosynthesis C-methylase UbiE